MKKQIVNGCSLYQTVIRQGWVCSHCESEMHVESLPLVRVLLHFKRQIQETYRGLDSCLGQALQREAWLECKSQAVIAQD